MDELNFMNFIIKQLDEMISLFLTDKTTYQNEIISEEILQAFNFLFEGSVDNMQSIMQFNMFLKHPLVQSKMVNKNDFKKTTRILLSNSLIITQERRQNLC